MPIPLPSMVITKSPMKKPANCFSETNSPNIYLANKSSCMVAGNKILANIRHFDSHSLK